MSIFTLFLVAVSLSMDAFSLALLYGTLNLSKNEINKMSTTVGIFHFFMPLFGYLFGDILTLFLTFNADTLVGIIFVILAIQMFASIFKNEEVETLTNILSYLLFGFTVSIDSFTVGIGLGSLDYNIIIPCVIFSLTSFIFTYTGLKLGKTLASKLGKLATIFGSILLLTLGITYII